MFSKTNKNAFVQITVFDASNTVIQRLQLADDILERVVTIDSNAALANVFLRARGSVNDAVDFNIGVQLEVGSTASEYEPYTGTSYPVTWQTEAGTVYGGTVDVVSGVLTVTYGMVDLGTAGFTYNSGWGCWTKPAIDGVKKAVSNSTPVSAFCSIAKSVRASGYTSSHAVGTFAENESGTWFIDNGNSTTLDGQLCYELATPQTYQLTPQQIDLLKGTNNLWQSENGDMTVGYWLHG